LKDLAFVQSTGKSLIDGGNFQVRLCKPQI
jgi:hypothetical protein